MSNMAASQQKQFITLLKSVSCCFLIESTIFQRK